MEEEGWLEQGPATSQVRIDASERHTAEEHAAEDRILL